MKLLVIALTLFSFGWALMGCHKEVDPMPEIQSKVWINGAYPPATASIAVLATTKAATKLLNCVYFEREFPVQYDHLKGRIFDISIFIEALPLQGACAQAWIGRNVVQYDPTQMGFSGCPWPRVSLHEMAHVAGFSHATQEEKEIMDLVLERCK